MATSDNVGSGKPFRWNSEQIQHLLNCLHEYKAKLAYQGLDFDADRPLQYRCIRKSMAKIYSADDPSSFGPLQARRQLNWNGGGGMVASINCCQNCCQIKLRL